MHRTSRFHSMLAVSACATLATTLTAFAQVTSARLGGTVTDASGAVVGRAQVKATNTATNLTQATTANANGEYQFAALPPGPYSLTVMAPGFAQSVEQGIVLTVGQSATLPVVLTVGADTQSTTVNASEAMINSTSAEISTVIGENSVKELPLNGRDPSSLVFLSAGVTNELQSQASTLPTSNSFPTESGASAGGRTPGQHLVPARRRVEHGHVCTSGCAVPERGCDPGISRHHQ